MRREERARFAVQFYSGDPRNYLEVKNEYRKARIKLLKAETLYKDAVLYTQKCLRWWRYCWKQKEAARQEVLAAYIVLKEAELNALTKWYEYQSAYITYLQCMEECS